MDYQFDLNHARERDENDSLANHRGRFNWPELHRERTLYFTGHSLGLQPKSVRAAVDAELDQWAQYGVEGHFEGDHSWYEYHEYLTPAMARVVGGKSSEVVCMNSLTTNLHLLFVSFYRPNKQRFKILAEANLFPSDRYLLETQVRFHGFDPEQAIVEVQPEPGEYQIDDAAILAAIETHQDELALVFLGGVNYLSGQLFDMAAVTQAAHAVGAIAGFDLAHAAGNVPLALHDWDVDFAAWCSYKYLNGGPGNVGAIFVHERHGQSFDLPRFGGWWGHDKDRRFLMEPGFRPMPGAEGWQLSNAPILGMAALRASLDIFDAVGMTALRRKSEQLTGYLRFIVERLADEFPDAAIQIASPSEASRHGCQLSIDVAGRDRALFEAMTRAGIIADFREPHMIRVAPVPLYNAFEDVYWFGEGMRGLL